ncbi:hypothetical protein glysoja_018537 [Glycine soja]|nr:hypothetical protein glysoja_018537 [Glycine soja]
MIPPTTGRMLSQRTIGQMQINDTNEAELQFSFRLSQHVMTDMCWCQIYDNNNMPRNSPIGVQPLDRAHKLSFFFLGLGSMQVLDGFC